MTRLTRRSFAKGAIASLIASPSYLALSKAYADTEQPLVWLDGSDFRTLDPTLAGMRNEETILQLVFNRLADWADTDLSSVVGDAATSWEISEDQLEWTIHLRDDLVFHNGEKLTAHSVKFTMDRLRNPDFGATARSLLALVEEVQVVDDYTVKFITSKPYALLVENLCETTMSINDPKAVDEAGDQYSRNPVGSGQYVFKEWRPGQHTLLERNDDYVKTKGIAKQLMYKPVIEAESRVIELMTGNADVILNVPPESVDRIRANPELDVIEIPSSFQVVYELDCRKAPFIEPEVRTAINYAIDHRAIVEKVLGNYASVCNSPIPSGVQGHVPLPEYTYDPDRFLSVWKKYYPNGLGRPLQMWTPNGRYMKDALVAEAVQGYLNAVGIPTELRVWEWSAYSATLRLKKPGFRETAGEAANEGDMWILGTSVPTANWRFLRKIRTGATAGNTGYSNPRVDEILDNTLTNFNEAERLKQYEELQRIVWDQDTPFLYLYNQKQLVGIRKTVRNFEMYAHEIGKFGAMSKS